MPGLSEKTLAWIVIIALYSLGSLGLAIVLGKFLDTPDDGDGK